MPHIEVTYKKGSVSRGTIRGIVNALYCGACNKDIIPSESLDVYARKLGEFDRQRKTVMVRVYADPHYFIRSRDDVDRIEQAIWSMVSDYIDFPFVAVEVVTVPVTSNENASSI